VIILLENLNFYQDYYYFMEGKTIEETPNLYVIIFTKTSFFVFPYFGEKINIDSHNLIIFQKVRYI
jgi:hypothetical protein